MFIDTDIVAEDFREIIKDAKKFLRWTLILLLVAASLTFVISAFAGYDDWTPEQQAAMRTAAIQTGQKNIKKIRDALNARPSELVTTNAIVAVEKPLLIQKAEQGYLKQYARLIGDDSYKTAEYEYVVGLVITLDADDNLPNKFSPGIMSDAFEKMSEWWTTVRPNTQTSFHPYPWGITSFAVTNTFDIRVESPSIAEENGVGPVVNADVEKMGVL